MQETDTERELSILRDEVNALRDRIDALDRRPAGGIASPSASDSIDYPRPFHISYDAEEGEYCLFLPDGAVMVDGHNCTCDDRGYDLNVPLDIDPESLPEKIYGHVVVSEIDGTTTRKVSFDGSPTHESDDNDDKTFDFVVCSFGISENDGMSYDVCTSAVNFSTAEGGGGSVSVDDVSIGKNESDEIEIKDFHDRDDVESDSLVKVMTSSSSDNCETIERFNLTGSELALKFRPHGRFIKGDDTNIVFTPVQNSGDVKVDVYYK